MKTRTRALRCSALSALLVVLTGGGGALTHLPNEPASPVATRSVDSGGQAFSLYTHCGIDELQVDGRFYERVGGLLDDGSGNPPRGWDNPYQAGRVTRSGSVIIFSDDKGHRERFELRPGATAFTRTCS